MTTTVLVGNPKPQSRTWQAAHHVAELLTGRAADVDIDLASFGPALLDWSSELVSDAVARVRESSLVIVASPTYKATYTGLLKLFLDRIGGGELAGVKAVPLMLGGHWKHALAPEVHLKPVLAEFGAATPTAGLYLLDSEWRESAALTDWLAIARANLGVGDDMTVATSLDLRKVFGAYPTGVAALSARIDERPVGMAANSFTTVSLDPPLVSACVAHTSATWPLLRTSPRIGISILGSDQEWISRQLAAKGVDRFAGVGRRETDDGCVLIDGAAAWFDCSISQQVRAGDHDIVVFEVHDLDVNPGVAPLVFHASSYRTLA